MLMDAELDNRYSMKLTDDDPRYLPMGHDEALANQYDFNKKAWKAVKGAASETPKKPRKELK
jgi:hypothetical protein